MYFRVYRQHLHEITVSRLFHTLLAYPETAKLGFIVLLLDIKARNVRLPMQAAGLIMDVWSACSDMCLASVAPWLDAVGDVAWQVPAPSESRITCSWMLLKTQRFGSMSYKCSMMRRLKGPSRGTRK